MKTLLGCIFTLTFFPAFAQTTEDSVRNAVAGLFSAMINADAQQLKDCFTDSAILQTIATKDGMAIVKNEKISEFAEFIEKQTKGDADEKNSIVDIRIDGPLAMVWSNYRFFYKGKFSHCGVNSFQLVRTSLGWKIQYLIDTRRKQPCG